MWQVSDNDSESSRHRDGTGKVCFACILGNVAGYFEQYRKCCIERLDAQQLAERQASFYQSIESEMKVTCVFM